MAFLNARLAEDERDRFDCHDRFCGDCTCGYPERIAREVEAKRAIIAWWQLSDRSPAPSPTYENWRKSLPGYQLLLHIAAIYSDDPDYRQEWKP